VKASIVFLLSLFMGVALYAENSRYLAASEVLAEGDIVSIVSASPTSAGLWLEGRAGNDESGSTGLAVGDLGANSRTRWRIHESAPGIVAFECLGFADAPGWLNGTTYSGKVLLVLNPAGVSGAHWAVYREGTGFTFKCLGKVAGNRWLSTAPNRQVALVATTEKAPVVWQIYVWHKGAPPVPR
jgi:hypothetical protein